MDARATGAAAAAARAARAGTRTAQANERPLAPVRAARTGTRVPLRGERPLAPVDARVAAVATRQHGIVTRAQLVAAGLTRHGIAHRVAGGRLIRRSPGVFAVGHEGLGWSGVRVAALLSCGPYAVLSFDDAAVGASLLPAGAGPIHVTCRRGHRRGAEGVVVHRAHLEAAEVVRIGPLAMTTPARTLLDLAAAGEAAALAAALREARARRLVDPEALLARCAGRRGARLLRGLLADEPGLTRSEAERRLLVLLRRAGLPAPRTNVRVGRFEVDALIREQRLVIEVDGFAFHGGRDAFERDRARDADLQAAGYRVVRVTWRQIVERPEWVVARIAAMLAG